MNILKQVFAEEKREQEAKNKLKVPNFFGHKPDEEEGDSEDDEDFPTPTNFFKDLFEVLQGSGIDAAVTKYLSQACMVSLKILK